MARGRGLAPRIKVFKRQVSHSALERLATMLASTPVVFGPTDRLQIADEVRLQNAILNTMSGSIEIGRGTFCGHGVMVITGSHKFGEDVSPNARRTAVVPSGNDIRIGQDVWLGSGAIVIGPCEIGDRAVIAAGAIVKGVIEPDSVRIGQLATSHEPR